MGCESGKIKQLLITWVLEKREEGEVGGQMSKGNVLSGMRFEIVAQGWMPLT